VIPLWLVLIGASDKMMVKVEFITDFATKRKGEAWSCDSMLANSLIRRKVVKVYKEEDGNNRQNKTNRAAKARNK
jgi:hypothetical protein